jgi:hypothetical protein
VFAANCLFWLVFALQQIAVSRGSLQAVHVSMLSICTTVHQAHGQLLSSVWHAVILQPHLLGTWPSLPGVGQVIPILRGVLKSCCYDSFLLVTCG